MATQAKCVKVIQTETERLQQYLTALPQDAWTKPSACALWEIRDVVAHLSGVPTGFTIAITRGLQGDISPPEGAPDQSQRLEDTLAGGTAAVDDATRPATHRGQRASAQRPVVRCSAMPGTNSSILSPS